MKRRSTVTPRVVQPALMATPDASLLDMVDNLLTRGVVVSGDVVLGIAEVDLVYLRVSALLCAADKVLPPMAPGKRRLK